MTLNKSYPSLALSTALVLFLTAAWGALRLSLFGGSIFPLTFVIPLMICVWTRRRWHLWFMAGAFLVMAALKALWLMPPGSLSRWERSLLLFASCFNIIVGAVVIQLVMSLRDRMQERNARIKAQNAELEAQSEELSQQNEEIRTQSEELAQQNEEIESQAEELERQNQELTEGNERLGNREEMLQAVLQLSRARGGARQALDEVCRRALEIMDAPAEAIAVLELDGDDRLRLRAHARNESQPPLREYWPLTNSLARVVLQEDRTAYVDDLSERVDLAAPFAADGTVRSLLVTPLHVGGALAGVIVACASSPNHWTRDQFRLIEWVAAQCGLIVEALRWQNKLEARAREVEEANRAKDQFLAMLSHELRTPLTPVLAAAGTLETDMRLPEDARQDLAVIRRNVSVQSRLIDDLLDLTRVGRGKLELHRQVLSVSNLLRETAAIVASELDAREQTLTVQIDLPPNCAVEGDGPRLQQVFWNLLKNAIKFSPAKGRIALSARIASGTDSTIAISVSDSGIGIDKTDLQRIFLPFEQASLGRQRGNGQGLGLGLCIAKAVVELHGGKMRVSSAGVGHGATFTVELPVSTKPLPEQAPEPTNDTASRKIVSANSMLRILLVEDHEDTGLLLSRILKNHGHSVEHVRDITTAKRRVDDTPFDLVVSDLGLPDGSGLDLMRQIRLTRPELAGICLSGYGMESDVQASLDAGFAEHLTKPIDLQQLHSAISRIAHITRSATARSGAERMSTHSG